MRHVLIGIMAAALLTTGCVLDKYVVEMTPQGDSVRRTLTCWSEDSEDTGKPPVLQPLAKDELDRIAKLYGEKPTKAGPGKRAFVGNFKGALPSDVGGAGTYTRLPSEMGDLFLYSERFRGDDDQAKVVTNMLYAADQLTDLLILWFESEMKADTAWPKLREFMDASLRHDIKNVTLDLWMSGPVGKMEPGLARVAQYLTERGYIKPDDVPQAVALLYGGRDRQFVQRLVANRMGVPADSPLPASLGFLASPESTSASWDKFLAKSPAYKKWFADLDTRRLIPLARALNGGEERPDPGRPEDLLAPSLLASEFLVFGGQYQVDVTLNCKVAPIYANGTYDAAKGAVAWSEALGEPRALPALCTAVWAVPDEDFQKAHFARSVLTGKELALYILWRRGLDEGSAKEWLQFVSNLNPDATLAEKLKSFRFSTDPKAGEEPATSFADDRREIILEIIVRALEKLEK